MNAHTPFDAKQDWTNPYCQNSSNDPMVDALLGNAYHVVRTVYCNLGNLKLIYDFLNKYGMVLGVQSEAELKAMPTSASYVRLYGFDNTNKRVVTDYLYVDGDRTGVIPDDPSATGSWILVATSNSDSGGDAGEGKASPPYIPYSYNNGSAIGGETTIPVPAGTVGVPMIVIDGYTNLVGYGFTYDAASLTVTLAQPLEPGDEVHLFLTGTPAVPDNPNVSDWVQINWLYNGGYASGGEQVIQIPYTFKSVPTIYKNGARYYSGLAENSYTVDAVNQRILLTEPLTTNDRLIITIGGEPETLIMTDRTIQEVARSANVKDTEIILSTDTTQFLNGKKVIYDVAAQKIYGLPTLPSNVYINSVSNGQLTYSPGNITVTLLDPYQQQNIRELWCRSLAEAGLTLVDGSFEEGATANSATDVVWHIAGGQCYTWGGAFPKTIPADSTPTSTGGVGPSAWVSVGDVSLRGQISSKYGLSIIGGFESVDDMRSYSSSASLPDGTRAFLFSFYAGKNIGGGIFQWHSNATTADDGFSVIKPSSVSGAGRWINIKRGRLTPEECGCVPNDPSFDNGVPLNRWASQQHCIGSVGVFYKTTALIPSPPAHPQYIDAKGMRLMTTVANVNGVELPKDTSRRIIIEGLESFGDYSLTATDRNKANGFYIAGSREVTLKNIRCEGWKNAGVWWFEVNNMTIDGFVGWRNDWDGSPRFSSGGDLVEWTSPAGVAKSCSITNFLCLSDSSQGISVNSLSVGRNILISNGRCFTYDATDFTPKEHSNIKARHGITIGYNSNQTYGGGVKVSNVIIRDKGWTGIYRSGGLDGAVRYQPATISNVSVYDCGFGINQDNIGAGILFGDVVDGDMINNCYVEGFANANNGAYKIQDSVGTGKLTIANCVDKGSAGYGVHIATESVNVMVIGHRSIEPTGAGIFLEPKGGATLFRFHTIDGCRIERVTDGYGIFVSSGVIRANIKNNEIHGTSTDSTSNCAIRVNQNGQNINIRGNQIYGFAYGLWYNTYVDTTTIFPWGNNQFFGCINAHRFARTTGSSVAKVEPNYYDAATPNRFSNGGVGTSNGTEEFRVNGTPVT